MAQIGVRAPGGLTPAGQANSSLPRAAMEIVRRANHELPREASLALSGYLLREGPGLKPVPNGEVEMFGAALRADMAEEFAPVHDWLSGVAGKPFFDDIAELGRVRPVPEDEAMHDLLAKVDTAALTSPDAAEFVLRLRKEHAI